MADKYRGTTTYHLVFSELIRAAQHSGVTTYQEVALIMGLPMQGNHMATEVGQMLGEISEDEVRQGRPMLSAVAVNTAGQPGSGFYGLASDLGLLKDDSDSAKRQFWDRTKAEVYKAWRKKFKPIYAQPRVQEARLIWERGKEKIQDGSDRPLRHPSVVDFTGRPSEVSSTVGWTNSLSLVAVPVAVGFLEA